MNAKTNTVAKTEDVAVETKKDLTKFGTPTELYAKHKTWSGVFRHLLAQGLTRGEVAKVTGKRYQHVRNVQVTPIKKAS